MMRHGPFRPGARRALLLGGLVGLLAWGCGGQSLFGPERQVFEEDTLDPQVTIEAPAPNEAVLQGQTLDVRARVTDNVGVVFVLVEGLEGFEPVELDLVPAVRDTTLTFAMQPVPEQPEGPADIVVTAWDAADNQGTARVTIQVQPAQEP
jgi:hypothetical protein